MSAPDKYHYWTTEEERREALMFFYKTAAGSLFRRRLDNELDHRSPLNKAPAPVFTITGSVGVLVISHALSSIGIFKNFFYQVAERSAIKAAESGLQFLLNRGHAPQRVAEDIMVPVEPVSTERDEGLDTDTIGIALAAADDMRLQATTRVLKACQTILDARS